AAPRGCLALPGPARAIHGRSCDGLPWPSHGPVRGRQPHCGTAQSGPPAFRLISKFDIFHPVIPLFVFLYRCMIFPSRIYRTYLMQLKNTAQRYGLVAILLHWLVAATVIGLAILGLWMTDLSYYSPYYRSAPFWHKSIGITLAAVLVLRLLWRWGNPRPAHLPNHQRWELGMAALVHGLLYLLLFVIVVSGYLISTAKGQGISVFGWF